MAITWPAAPATMNCTASALNRMPRHNNAIGTVVRVTKSNAGARPYMIAEDPDH